MSIYIWPFHLVQCFHGLSCCSTCQNFIPFLWLHNIPLCEYLTVCLPIHLLMNIWAVSAFGLLQIILLWTCVYKFLFEYLFSIRWGISQGVELLRHQITLWLTFEWPPNSFPEQLHHFTLSPALWEGPCFSISLSIFLPLAILGGVKW